MKVPFHFWSEDGSSLPVALKIQREGHPVTMFIKSPEAQDIGKGLVTRSVDPPKGSVVIFDCVGFGTIGKMYRKMGHLVIGGNPMEIALEKDRTEGIKIMHKGGIKTPPTFPFADIPR